LLPIILGVGVSVLIDSHWENDTVPTVEVWTELRYKVVIWVIVTTIIGLGTGLIIVYALVRPVEKIQEAVQQLSEGKPAAQVDLGTSIDEINTLGKSFNKMVDSLQRMFTERNMHISGQISGGILWVNLNGVIGSMNDTARELFNLSEEKMLGKSIIELLKGIPGNIDICETLEKCLKEGSELYSHKTFLVNEEEQATPVAVSTTCLEGADGNPYNIVIHIQNLARLKEFYKKMNRADRLAAIGTFAMGMAHEIRNPLGSIKGLTQLMTQGNISQEDANQYGEVILSEVNRLDKLLSELLAFSEPVGQSLIPTNVGQLVRQSHDMALLKTRESVEDFNEAELDIDADVEMSMPRDKVFQALLNIIQNAYEAAAPVKGKVWISLNKTDDDHIRLIVGNSGTTIPEEQREKIFEPFFTTKEQGTGLGLAITYQILRYMNADIKLECLDDQVEFVIDIPIIKPGTLYQDSTGFSTSSAA
jgi:two-component system sensor histidine kinase AtoS